MNLPENYSALNDLSWMARAIELASRGGRDVAPNPMVGAVIVSGDTVLGEGHHQYFGGPHAEVNALAAVKDVSLLPNSTLYVNLEPCCSFGKTPPCVDRILSSGIRRVVVAIRDSNPQNARGIEQLRASGVEVSVGVLQREAQELNRRFITFQTKQRPYIILKWAQSRDGFLGPIGRPLWLTTMKSKALVHKWRAEESAVLVGTETAAIDNPALTVREVAGKSPLRIVLDRAHRLPQSLKIFDGTTATLLFTEKRGLQRPGVEEIEVRFDHSLLQNLLRVLYEREILSVMIEGGAKLLNSFIQEGLWDEVRVFTAAKPLHSGVVAPSINLVDTEVFDSSSETGDHLTIYRPRSYKN